MTIYEKVGRKYVPVQDTLAFHGLTNGSWLVVIENGITKIRKSIADQEGLKILAASTRWLEEWLGKELQESSACHYGQSGRNLNSKEIRAYKAYEKIMGRNATMWMTKPAAADVAINICKKICEKICQELV